MDVVIRPHHLSVSEADGESGSARFVPGRAVVKEARFLGNESLVILAVGQSFLRARIRDVPPPKPGSSVTVSLPSDRCFVFPRLSPVAA